jgi:hypothetical protein
MYLPYYFVWIMDTGCIRFMFILLVICSFTDSVYADACCHTGQKFFLCCRTEQQGKKSQYRWARRTHGGVSLTRQQWSSPASRDVNGEFPGLNPQTRNHEHRPAPESDLRYENPSISIPDRVLNTHGYPYLTIQNFSI